PPVRFDTNADLVGAVDVISLAGAVKITPRLALGATFNFWRGDWDEDDAVGQTPLAGPELPSSLLFSQSTRIRGNSVGLGLMLTYPRWSVGIVHQGPLASDFHNDTRVTVSGVPEPPSQTIEGTLHFPRAFGIGGAWRPAPRWTVALDLTRD